MTDATLRDEWAKRCGEPRRIGIGHVDCPDLEEL
jgi:hypothetical protein